MDKLCNEIERTFHNYNKNLGISNIPFYIKYIDLLKNNTTLLTNLNNHIILNIDNINIDLVYGLYDIYNNLDNIKLDNMKLVNMKLVKKILKKQKKKIEKTIIENYSFEDEMKLIEISTEKLMNYNSAKKNKSKEIQGMIKIVEEFIKRKKLLCYGGQAINNILPKEHKFYKDSLLILFLSVAVSK